MTTVQNIPSVVYKLTSTDLFEILNEYIELDPEHSSCILTSLQHYEDKTLESKSSKYKGKSKYTNPKQLPRGQKKNIPPPFKSKRTIEFFIMVKT